jgi:hypothetical protein
MWGGGLDRVAYRERGQGVLVGIDELAFVFGFFSLALRSVAFAIERGDFAFPDRWHLGRCC